MSPEEYIQKTGASYIEIAHLCDRAYETVAKWFCRGKSRRKPTAQDCKILELYYRLTYG